MTQSTFDVAKLTTTISVRSLEGTTPVEVEHGSTKRVVETDHVARIRRKVTFTDADQPDELFEIRYATRAGGYVKPVWEGAENLATSADMGRYEDYGVECLFAFRPSVTGPGPYVLDVEVLDGFGPDRRDVHFHLGRNRHYRELEYQLDLSEFADPAAADLDPALYLHPDDPSHGKLINMRKVTSAAQRIASRPRVWSWRFSDVTSGLIDLYWG